MRLDKIMVPAFVAIKLKSVPKILRFLFWKIVVLFGALLVVVLSVSFQFSSTFLLTIKLAREEMLL
jgi:hypothetical protein